MKTKVESISLMPLLRIPLTTKRRTLGMTPIAVGLPNGDTTCTGLPRNTPS